MTRADGGPLGDTVQDAVHRGADPVTLAGVAGSAPLTVAAQRQAMIPASSASTFRWSEAQDA
jgi:hypothetical protein